MPQGVDTGVRIPNNVWIGIGFVSWVDQSERDGCMKFSVTTVITKEWTVEQTVEMLTTIGYDGVEWRASDGCSLSTESVVARAEELRDLCHQARLTICALAGNIDMGNEALLREMFGAAKAMGSPTARVATARYDGSTHYNTLFDQCRRWMETVVDVAVETGVKATIELHGGTIIPSASAARRLVDGLPAQHLGVIFDPGNQVREGMENWQLGIELLGDYLALVHSKNCTWVQVEQDGQRVWTTQQVPSPDGIADWAAIISHLKTIGYEGFISCEDFTTRPVEQKLRDELAYMKSLL